MEPLDAYVEIEKPDGTRYRWDGHGLAENAPTSLVHGTKRQDGYSTASCVLPRDITRDWVDIELRDKFTVFAASGDVRWQGRVSATPRELDADGHQIEVQATGYMAAARDRKFQGGYVDRDAGSWHPPPLSRQAALATAGRGSSRIQADAGRGGLTFTPPAEALAANEGAELHYDAGERSRLAKVMYKGSRTGAFTNFESPALFTDDAEALPSPTSTGLTLDGTVRTATPAAAERYAMLRAATTGVVTPGQGWLQRLDHVAAYDDHGLTTYPIAGEPDGILASDGIRHIVESYTPLKWAGNATSYPVPHMVFRELTHPYDAMLQWNAFHIWDLAVWDDLKLYYWPVVLDEWDWEIPLEQPGVRVRWEGDSDEDLANGIIVEYTELTTGAPRVLYPDEHAELRDDSPLNPANRHGDRAWTDEKLPSPATEAMALQIGRAKLAEFNLPKHPGSYTIEGGYVRDRQGNRQPGSKVRASERALVTSAEGATVRVIGETSWVQDSKSLTLSTDGPLRVMDAFQDRLATALVAHNLA